MMILTEMEIARSARKAEDGTRTDVRPLILEPTTSYSMGQTGSRFAWTEPDLLLPWPHNCQTYAVFALNSPPSLITHPLRALPQLTLSLSPFFSLSLSPPPSTSISLRLLLIHQSRPRRATWTVENQRSETAGRKKGEPGKTTGLLQWSDRRARERTHEWTQKPLDILLSPRPRPPSSKGRIW